MPVLYRGSAVPKGSTGCPPLRKAGHNLTFPRATSFTPVHACSPHDTFLTEAKLPMRCADPRCTLRACQLHTRRRQHVVTGAIQ